MVSRKTQAFDDYLKANESADYESIAAVFGQLPPYIDANTHHRILAAIASFRAADQSPQSIAALVEQSSQSKLTIPGTVIDVADFIKSANYLAHVRWAISLGKARAIQELEGDRAARPYRRSNIANEAIYGPAAERTVRNAKIQAEAREMRKRTRPPTENALAMELAAKYGRTHRHIKRILAGKGISSK